MRRAIVVGPESHLIVQGMGCGGNYGNVQSFGNRYRQGTVEARIRAQRALFQRLCDSEELLRMRLQQVFRFESEVAIIVGHFHARSQEHRAKGQSNHRLDLFDSHRFVSP
jgi:hypothetical protein